MKAFVLVALFVVFAAAVVANEIEEEETQFHGLHFKRCESDSDCRRGCCRKRWCTKKCTKSCKSEDDCDDGQCCLKRFSSLNGKCRSYLKEGDKCHKKSNFGLGMMKKSCGCAEGLECKVKKAFFFFRSGKCVTAEGSGEM